MTFSQKARPKYGKIGTRWKDLRTGKVFEVVSRASDQIVTASGAIAMWTRTTKSGLSFITVPVWRVINTKTKRMTFVRDDTLGRKARVYP